MTRILRVVALIAVAMSAQADDAEKVIPASDSTTQITVPAAWTRLELNDEAEIQVGNAADEAYLIVLNEPKDDLFGWNLEKHSRVTLGRLLSGVAFPTISGPKTVTVSGSPGVQYEIRGAAENQNIIYIHTTVEGPKRFSQILAWTLPSRAEKVLPQLRKAILTFRDVP